MGRLIFLKSLCEPEYSGALSIVNMIIKGILQMRRATSHKKDGTKDKKLNASKSIMSLQIA
jgi:hypothetical protein